MEPFGDIEAPKPAHVKLEVSGRTVRALDDAHSDRIRCDHPRGVDGAELGVRLLDVAKKRRRGRVVVVAPRAVGEQMPRSSYRVEGRMPGFYRGDVDALVLGAYPNPVRGELAKPDTVADVRRIVAAKAAQPVAPAVVPRGTRRANRSDAPAIARLIGQTFASYPTPSSDPSYIASAIDDGVPFRMIETDGKVVACASADLVRDARTAELTDCATRPSHRGRGYMRRILADLMRDLSAMGYPTAFTLARARIVGVNLAFARLGFLHRGTMPRSCRIGDGIEDMNVWSRTLEPLTH